MSLKNRLNGHFALCAAAAGAAVAGSAQQSDAAIVYSGVVNLPIANTTNGLYLNVVTGQINEPGNTAGGTVPGWDINPYGGTSLIMFNPAAPAGGVYVQRTGGGAPANLPLGTVIGAVNGGGRLYGAGTAATTGSDPWVLNGGDNIVGFRFQNEANANQTHYGWFRVRVGAALGGAGATRTLVDYAYEDVAGTDIVAAPAPGSIALLALGAFGLTGRRRK